MVDSLGKNIPGNDRNRNNMKGEDQRLLEMPERKKKNKKTVVAAMCTLFTI